MWPWCEPHQDIAHVKTRTPQKIMHSQCQISTRISRAGGRMCEIENELWISDHNAKCLENQLYLHTPGKSRPRSVWTRGYSCIVSCLLGPNFETIIRTYVILWGPGKAFTVLISSCRCFAMSTPIGPYSAAAQICLPLKRLMLRGASCFSHWHKLRCYLAQELFMCM